MFPMISQVDEFDQAKLVIERELTYLRQPGGGHAEFADMLLGAIAALPAVVDAWLQHNHSAQDS